LRRRQQGFIIDGMTAKSESTEKDIRPIEDFLRAIEVEEGLARNTIDGYRRDLLEFWTYLGGRPLAEVSKNALIRYLHELYGMGLNPSTVNRRLSALRKFLGFHLGKDSPAAGISGPRLTRRLPVVLSVREVQKILQMPDTKDVRQIRDAAILETLYASGMRRYRISWSPARGTGNAWRPWAVMPSRPSTDISSNPGRCWPKGKKSATDYLSRGEVRGSAGPVCGS
jgi:integrase